MHNYHDANGSLPPIRIHGGPGYLTWAVLIMPFMEQQAAYSQFNLNVGYAAQSAAARQVEVKSYLCPSRRGPGQGLSVAEDWYVNDATPPPEPKPAEALQKRFSAAQNPPGAVSDYAGCVGDMRGAPNDPNAQNWFNTSSNGMLIIGTATPAPNTSAAPTTVLTSWKSNTNIPSISDGKIGR